MLYRRAVVVAAANTVLCTVAVLLVLRRRKYLRKQEAPNDVLNAAVQQQQRRKGDELRIGCGAGYQGDRVRPAAELLGAVPNLDYLFLECLAERTLAIAHSRMANKTGPGYDPRLPQWLATLLPICAKSGCKLVANLGAADPKSGAAMAAMVVGQLRLRHHATGLPLKVVGVGETVEAQRRAVGAAYTYLGADAVVAALEAGADVVITGRVADPSLLVGCVAYEFGWDLADPNLADRIATATCAGHLLECGYHLTGGFFFHPCGRAPPSETPMPSRFAPSEAPPCPSMARMGMPYAILRDGEGGGSLASGTFDVCRPHGTGGELSVRTCTQQLLYEVHDVTAYVTPDCSADFSAVTFSPVSPHRVTVSGVRSSGTRPPTLLRLRATPAGVRQVGEVSFGGAGCVQRSEWAESQVRFWMEQEAPGSTRGLVVSRPGLDALFRPGEGRTGLGSGGSAAGPSSPPDGGVAVPEVRLRFEGVFDSSLGALALSQALGGLGVGGPAGACGGFMQSSAFGDPVTAITKEFVPRQAAPFTVWSKTPEVARAVGRALAALRRGPDPRLMALAAKGAAAAQEARDVAEAEAAAQEAVRTWSPIRRGSFGGAGDNYSTPPSPIGAQLPAAFGQAVEMPAPGSVIRLYDACHSRAGDKGNTCNVSLIAFAEWEGHFDHIAAALTPEVLAGHFHRLLDTSGGSKAVSVKVHKMSHLHALNIVLEPVLDGGVSVSRRLDPHGKSFSDHLLSIRLAVPPLMSEEWRYGYVEE